MGNLVGVQCDGTGCEKILHWDPEQVKEKADAMPDGAFRIISFVPFAGGAKVFCGKFCLLEYLRKYENPKSPAEIAREEAAKAPIPIDRKKLFPGSVITETQTAEVAVETSSETEQDQGDPVA